MDDRTYRVSDDLVLAEIDEQLVGMSIQSGHYHNFGKTGSDILTMLKDGESLGTVVRRLTSEYDVTEETCREEILRFIDKLVSLKIVEPVT